MKEILKYYKILFTLPSARTVAAILLASYALLLKDLKLLAFSVLYQLYFALLFYEKRVLNGRRLGFLFAVSNALTAFRPEVATVLYSMTSALTIPHPFIEVIAVTPWMVLFPKSIAALAPLWIASLYGYSKGVMPLGIAWLRAWMGDDYVHLEEILTKYGNDRTAKFLNMGPLTFTDVHFGLMRYSMGTLFPYLLLSNGRVPHRLCGSHENNPANRWETFKIILNYKRSLENSNKGETSKITLRREMNESIEVLDLNDEVKVIYHKQGADDLECHDYGSEIADPHNNEGDPIPANVLEGELKGLRELWSDECSFGGVSEVAVKGKGLCWRKGLLVRLNCRGGKREWLVIFGNNMKRGNRDVLLREGLLEVSTLDDHTCAGFGRRKYDVSEVAGFESVGELDIANLRNALRVKYRSMGDLIYREEVRENVTRSIKLGIASVALSLLLGLLV